MYILDLELAMLMRGSGGGGGKAAISAERNFSVVSACCL